VRLVVATVADNCNKVETNSTSKRRRIQVDDTDDGEMEFKFDDDISADESEYKHDTSNEEDDDQLVTDDDANQSPPRKRNRISKSQSSHNVTPCISLSQFKADKIKITEYKSSSAFASESETPKRVTPNGLHSTGHKKPIPFSTPPIISASSLSCSSPIAGSVNKDAPPMFILNEVNPPGSHVHNHLKFLQNPKDSVGRTPEHPEYDKRTLQVNEKDWFRVTKKEMTDAVKQWWDLKSQYFDTVLLFKTGMFVMHLLCIRLMKDLSKIFTSLNPFLQENFMNCFTWMQI
jgi:DNA mismatch repair protein MSH6